MSYNETDKIKDRDWLTLTEEEDIVAWGHPSLYTFLPQILVGAFLAIGAIVAPLYLGIEFTQTVIIVVLGVFLVGIATMFWEVIQYTNKFYVLTTEKVKRKQHWIARDTTSIQFENVENVETNQSVTERVLGFGDVRIASAATGGQEVRLENASKPYQYAELINDGSQDGVIDEV